MVIFGGFVSRNLGRFAYKGENVCHFNKCMFQGFSRVEPQGGETHVRSI